LGVSFAASCQSVTLPPSRRNGVPLPPGPMPLPLHGPPASGCCIEMWLAPRGRWTEYEGSSSAQTQKEKLSAVRLAKKRKKKKSKAKTKTRKKPMECIVWE